MKFSIASFVVLATVAEGFSPALFGVRTTSTSQLLATRVDSSALVKEALAASKEFGPASPQARLAWEAVEEVDSSDNSAATKPSLDEECLTEGDASRACMDYSAKLNELESLVGAQKPILNTMKKIAEEIRAVKLTIPEPSVGTPSAKLLDALAEAKAVSEAKGATSPEAKVAWDAVEEIAAAGNSEAMGDILTADECLIEAAQSACEALEELNRVLELAKADGAYQS